MATAVFKTMAAAESEIGGLSAPGKMPEGSYSISAWHCQTGGKLAEIIGTVCHGCYARKNRYAFDNVRKANERRAARVAAACADPADSGARWVAALAYLLNRREVKHFRWHDSGDLQGIVHLDLIVQVCRATPSTLHWLPTKEPRYVKRWESVYGPLPANLCVRVSAPMIDGPAPAMAECASTVHHALPAAPDATVCGASTRGGVCGPCRACWQRSVSVVSYPKH